MVTVARISPVTTGPTIVDVMASSQISASSSRTTPTRYHDENPRSRSQRGAAKTVESSLNSSAPTRCASSD